MFTVIDIYCYLVFLSQYIVCKLYYNNSHSICDFRLALKSVDSDSLSYTTGFVTASSWTLEVEAGKTSTDSTPCKTPLEHDPAVSP
jgi:hypothetical protein